MSKAENFLAVISDWFSRDIPIVHERELDIPLNLEVVVSIIGPRRSGKTYLMYNLAAKSLGLPEAKIITYNFEGEDAFDEVSIKYIPFWIWALPNMQ